MILSGYISAIIIGVSLGMIGGGGSILTVPVLVYLFHIAPLQATAYSLFIVGSTSLAGGIQKFMQGNVNLKAVLVFGIPSVAAVFMTRMFLVPILPHVFFTVGNFSFTRDIFIMSLFAVLMILASVSMIYQKEIEKKETELASAVYNYPLIIAEGIIVGVLTGLVGAGGGFLIIPALVIFTRLPMKMAVGTSLLIIALKSLIGFIGDLGHMEIDWKLLFIFTALAVGGIFLGNRWSHGIDNLKLKKAFGWFVLVMGIYIFLKEIFFS